MSKICKSVYLEPRRISSVRHVLTVAATKTLMTSLVLSCLDYCNSLLSGIPQQLLDKLRKVKNCSARLIFKTSKWTHVSPLLAKLHWLPIAQRIDYKMSSLCYDVVSDTAPLYLSDLLCLYVPSRSLRSSADTRIFRIPTRKKEKVPRAACFLPSRPCHLEQTPLLCTSCSNTIPVQSSTKNHAIPLSVRTRLLEFLCVFNCLPYFTTCKSVCDLHLCVRE